MSTRKWIFLSRFSLPYKILAVFLGLSLSFLGGLFYVKSSLTAWCAQHQYELIIKGTHFHWHHWGVPGVTFQEVYIKNKDPEGSFHHLQANNISLQPYLFSFFQFYLKGYKIVLEIKNLKIKLTSGDVVEGDRITSDIIYKENTYHIKDFNLEPLRMILGPESTTLTNENEPNLKGAHLVIYQIKGNAQYLSPQNTLQLYFEVPPAALQMPKGHTYRIYTKGEIKFLTASLDQKVLKKEDLGIRGKIVVTIHNLSNFLRHLYQARMISNVTKNLGSIVGRSVSREELFSQQKEIFTEPTSVDLTFQEGGVYVGPMKL